MELCIDQSRREYEAFIESHIKGHFMQLPAWGSLKSSWRWEGIIVRGKDGLIKGVMSVLIRRLPLFNVNLMYSPRGPVCDIYDEATLLELTRGVRELARKNRAFALRMDSDVKADDKEYERIMRSLGYKIKKAGKNFEGIQPRFVFRLFLQGRNEEELMASFHSKTRYNIRLAEKKGVTVKIADKSALDEFQPIMVETGLRDGFVIRPKEYFEKLLDCLGENARLYMAYHEGEAIAGTLAVRFGDKVWYLYGASSNRSRNLMPNYLLQWEMIKWAVESHCRIYDFRGVSGNLDPDSPLYGLYRFKKGFNGEFTEFIGEMELVFSPLTNLMVGISERIFRTLRKYIFLYKSKRKEKEKEKEA